MISKATPPPVSRYGTLSVLFVMATEQEYGPHLQRRITPVITGVGPVEAAVGAAAALGELDRVGALPDLVCSLGTAGSASLEHAGIYQVSSVAYRDMDASPIGFDKGVTPFSGEPAVIAVADRIPDIPAASISTGGNIVSGKAYDAIAADMVDMETYSVARAARRFGVPMIGLRGISDGRSDLTGLHDWTEFLHILDEKLAVCLDAFADHVAEGRFRPGAGDAGGTG
ncbi:MAG: 5'-methylthioadenosine/S-adenosylhomocysteine nucleosidase [Bauldia litoralis]|uniref:5'-methylthioadenosine/S-adenosylhomocysteine nucleosidase n=1 Tax=Bauldia litoralis TaxID=665467 RepID=UPI003298413B